MATLLSDTFDRANSTTTVGAPQIGPAPVVQAGTAGIISNMLYGAVAPALVTWDLGTPNVELSVTTNSTSTSNWIAIVLGYVSATNYYQVMFTPAAGITLYKVEPGGTAVMFQTFRNTSFPGSGTVLKMSYRAGIIRVYADGVLYIRQALDLPITSNVHGLRFGNTVSRLDNLLGADSAVIADPILAGKIKEPEPAAMNPVFTPAFAYKGRDTKILDQAAGA